MKAVDRMRSRQQRPHAVIPGARRDQAGQVGDQEGQGAQAGQGGDRADQVVRDVQDDSSLRG